MVERSAFHTLSYGLYLITAITSDGRKVGCVANTFQQAASKPPMASVALNKENVTTQAILETGRYGVSVLSQTATMELIGQFGFKSSNEIDKYEGIAFDLSEMGIPNVLASTVAVFDVDVVERVDVGTHVMFIGPVVEARKVADEQPLTYAYYHEVLRGKTPPKAASYTGDISEEGTQETAEETAEKATEQLNADGPKFAWRCTICGHIEMVDELPDDFVCPICGVGKEMFERIEL